MSNADHKDGHGRESVATMPETPSRYRRLVRRCLQVGAAGTLAAALGIGTLATVIHVQVTDLDPPPVAVVERLSHIVVDREDRLLRAYTTPGGRWRLPISADAVDPRYLAFLKAYEDSRFGRHDGVDWVAVLRSAWLAVRYGRVVSGASTLTMQVARLMERRHERTPAGKWRQMLRAIQLERTFSKTEILDIYLRLAPFGGNLEGARAASLSYFGKEPRRLSIGEAALLVALPQAPEGRRPDRHPEAAIRGRARVLTRMVTAGLITPHEADLANSEPMPRERLPFPMLAPHLSDRLVAGPTPDEKGGQNDGLGEKLSAEAMIRGALAHAAADRPIAAMAVATTAARRIHRTTLDLDLQARLEVTARRHAERIGTQTSAALMVVDHTSGAVLAHVGSPGYLDDARFGAIDMTRGVRSPGSALKPLIYGLAFEQGVAHPATLIDDKPVVYGSYRPKNFDGDYAGTITVADALQRSLNVPAVKLLQAVGPARLMARLHTIGLRPDVPGNGPPSLALALGGLGFTLEEMASLYAAMARGGEAVPLQFRREGEGSLIERRHAVGARGHTYRPRILRLEAAWQVGRVLRGSPPPDHAERGTIAFKTGTSYGYRDAWAAGFDGRHTIVAWVGRPDDAPTPGLTGLTAAAPLLFDAFQRVSAEPAPHRPAPDGVVHARTGDLPPPLQRFGPDRAAAAHAGAFTSDALRIAFPPDRTELDLTDGSALAVKAEGGRLPLTWLADGRPVARSRFRREADWMPSGAGFVTLSVIDADGQAARARVRLTAP